MPVRKKSGTKPKDSGITELINMEKKGILTGRELRIARLEALKLETEKRDRQREISQLKKELSETKLEVKKKKGKGGVKKTKGIDGRGDGGDDGDDGDDGNDEVFSLTSLRKSGSLSSANGNSKPYSKPHSGSVDLDDVKSAYQMLQDMRAVYKKVGGRKKLEELVSSDDKQFAFMVKELMKIESQLKQAEIRKRDGENDDGNSRNFFVVLKGLESEKDILMAVEKERKTDGEINYKQISHVLNPDGSFYEEEGEEADEADVWK